MESQVVWRWHGHDLLMRLTDHLSDEPPPVAWVTSVRCVVLWRGRVLVVQDPHHYHILPGGRREPGESLEETACREVLEETGWLVEQLQLVGFRHFHHREPKPKGYPFLYPDFIQVVYSGLAVEFRPAAKEVNGFELGSTMRHLSDLTDFHLTPGEHFYLRASLQKRRALALKPGNPHP
ncbi:MAG: NUDIX hydrolase [Chloroflexi bacterium]|nr:NUDIX hydrolase [Chloroflexota bacterium]